MGIQKITPFLWFPNQAEEAAYFYTSIFPNSRVNHVRRFPGGGEEVHGHAEGGVMSVEFELDGQAFVALNGSASFGFTEAISFHVSCASQEEVDHYWEKLGEGGQELQCGWLKDKFGVTWQVVPAILGELLGDPDPAKAERVNRAMLLMKKLDIAALERARDGR